VIQKHYGFPILMGIKKGNHYCELGPLGGLIESGWGCSARTFPRCVLFAQSSKGSLGFGGNLPPSSLTNWMVARVCTKRPMGAGGCVRRTNRISDAISWMKLTDWLTDSHRRGLRMEAVCQLSHVDTHSEQELKNKLKAKLKYINYECKG